MTAQRDMPTIVTVLCQIPSLDGDSVMVTAATNLDSFLTKKKRKDRIYMILGINCQSMTLYLSEA